MRKLGGGVGGGHRGHTQNLFSGACTQTWAIKFRINQSACPAYRVASLSDLGTFWSTWMMKGYVMCCPCSLRTCRATMLAHRSGICIQPIMEFASVSIASTVRLCLTALSSICFFHLVPTRRAHSRPPLRNKVSAEACAIVNLLVASHNQRMGSGIGGVQLLVRSAYGKGTDTETF